MATREFQITAFDGDHHLQSPSKRRRISALDKSDLSNGPPTFTGDFSVLEAVEGTGTGQDSCQDDHENISISASSKQAGQTVAPFLTKHIPEQYAPGGGFDSLGKAKQKDPNTKYCYRHRPDLKCRRQANEPSMDQLQHVGQTPHCYR